MKNKYQFISHIESKPFLTFAVLNALLNIF